MRVLIVNDNPAYKPRANQCKLLKKICESLGYKATINTSQFPPDCTIIINGTRLDFPDLMNSKGRVISWFQDSTSKHCNDAYAYRWNHECSKDSIVGYTNVLEPHGYDKNRMFFLPMVPDFYVLNRDKPAQKVENDITFMSSKGEPIEVFMNNNRNVLMTSGLSEDEITKIVEAIEDTIVGHFQNKNKLLSCMEEMNNVVRKYMSEGFYHGKWLNNPTLQSMQIFFFWHVYERLLRQKIVFDIQHSKTMPLRVFGEGWVSNKVFPFSGHALEQSDMYAKIKRSKLSLHINSYYGYHPRILEILMSFSKPLFFYPYHDKDVAKYEPEKFKRSQIINSIHIYIEKFWRDMIMTGEFDMINNTKELTKILDVHKYCYVFKNIDELKIIKEKVCRKN